VIDEIQALLTITILIIANWWTGGDSRLPNVADCMVREGVGNDFETDPESENAVEIFNWRLISSSFQSVS
jgi:hypothetical protein